MITVNIKGGLGNQMFQYACARALSLKNNDNLQLIRNESIGDIARPFSLTAFDIQGEVVTEKNVPSCLRILSKIRQKITREFYVNFQPSILNRKGEVYLDGYFQSEKYFIDFVDIIRQDFILKGSLTKQAAEAAALIQASLSGISLHVRRGDYLKESDFKDIADKEYYKKAIDYIVEKIDNAHFFIFSDDIEWCKSNLTLPSNTVFVSGPEMKDYEELTLMSLCRHHIIANSSFSWWGAWLGSNPEKIVITPIRWANVHEDWYRDIIPETWIRI